MLTVTRISSCLRLKFFQRFKSSATSGLQEEQQERVRVAAATTAVTAHNDPQPQAREPGDSATVVDVPFRRARRGDFFQARPQLGNVFLEDAPLRSYLQRLLPNEVLQAISPDLERFGQRVVEEITDIGRQCDEDLPYVKHFDAWGNRVDELVTSEAWKRQKAITAEEGIIAIPYEKEFGAWSRLYQAAKLLLYYPSSGLYYCPVAMTDGAASVLEGLKGSELFANAFSHVTSRDPKEMWTSGQWMTEKRGGSDVAGGTETLAYPQADGSYRLYGFKWFSSATDCDMTIALARVVDENDQFIEGTKGVSLFYLETKSPDGSLNGIEIQRLKNKLGTRQVPTAELLLDGTKAYCISEPGRGVRSIIPMLSLTRFQTGAFAASVMRRMVHYARDYSLRRRAFGRLILDWPLHVQTLSRMELQARGAMVLLMESALLVGKEEVGEATDDDCDLLRLIIPVLKLYTGKQAVSVCSEGLESIGGQGYIEDTGFPGFLRDAQVLPIWEGTTNILSLDIVRAVNKSGGKTMETFLRQVQTRSAPFLDAANQDVQATAQAIGQACDSLRDFVLESTNQDPAYMELAAKDFAYSIGRTYIGLLLLEHAAWEHAGEEDIAVAKRWSQQDLCPVATQKHRGAYSAESNFLDYKTVMAGYQRK